MRQSAFRSHLSALLPVLLLVACGGASEEELASPSESLGVQEAALCSGPSVSSPTIDGISLYQGEMAGSGTWTVSGGANAVQLEYYVNGAPSYSEQRVGSTGTWYYSMAGFACGTYTFVVKAMPMVIDSAGNRTVCSSISQSTSRSVTDPCPNPTASMSCARASSSTIRCTGSATGGSGSYTPYWQEWEYGYPYGWYAGTWTESFYCPSSTSGITWQVKYDFKVIDSNGMESNVVTRSYNCRGVQR